MTFARPTTREAVEHAAARRLRRQAHTRWWILGALALVAFALDQITKAIIRSNLELRESHDVFPGFDISRVNNEGIAFGLFAGRQSAIAILTVVALCAIAIALAGLVARNAVVAAGAGLLVGGSLGNLVDRLWHGAVTDFLDFAHWPAFNVADCGITVGAVLIVLGLLREDGERDDAG
ncbi:MAG: signal peptidase II [Thermoleophilia bacterium]